MELLWARRMDGIWRWRILLPECTCVKELWHSWTRHHWLRTDAPTPHFLFTSSSTQTDQNSANPGCVTTWSWMVKSSPVSMILRTQQSLKISPGMDIPEKFMNLSWRERTFKRWMFGSGGRTSTQPGQHTPSPPSSSFRIASLLAVFDEFVNQIQKESSTHVDSPHLFCSWWAVVLKRRCNDG